MLLIISYTSAAIFVGAVVYRCVKISRMPIHLRWELYPVAHDKGRAGGSYLQELDWWTKPRQTSRVGELKVMVPEILLLAGVWKHNRSHWLRSYPFHLGLYFLAGLIVLLLVGPLTGVALVRMTSVCGFAGLGLGLLGAVALLARRILESDYREYTKGADYFNLLFFILVLAVALATHVSVDSDFKALRAYFARLVTFDFSAAAALPVLSGVEILLASLLLAYIPLTHMSHFFTKWFTWHHIRWDDEPNLAGSKIEATVGQALQFPVSWAAPHIRGDGKKTWAEIAAESGANGESGKP